jgi:hypothetical protein
MSTAGDGEDVSRTGDSVMATGKRRSSWSAAVSGARIELGSAAWDEALQQIPEPPPSLTVRSDRLRTPGEVAEWLETGGSGLIVTWSFTWPSRFPRVDTDFISIDKVMQAIDQADESPFRLRPGVHSLYMPSGRADVGKTAGKLVVEPGVIASIEYRFRFPDGLFLPSTLRARRLDAAP